MTLLAAASGVTPSGAWRGWVFAALLCGAVVAAAFAASTFQPVQARARRCRRWFARTVLLVTWRAWTPVHFEDPFDGTLADPSILLGLCLAGRFNVDRFNRERTPITTRCTVTSGAETWTAEVEHTGFQSASECPRPHVSVHFPRQFDGASLRAGPYEVSWAVTYRGRTRRRKDRFDGGMRDD